MERQDSDPDVARMLAFCAGDAAAFDQLFESWAGPLLRHLERMVGDTGTAEELVQESFLRLYRARDRYEPRARFSTFLYRIATNLALNELKRPRRRHSHADQEDVLLTDHRDGIDRLAEQRQEHAGLELALAELPERQRTALWLSAAEGQSYREIANIMVTSEKSVKALVHRGRVATSNRMRRLWDRSDGVETLTKKQTQGPGGMAATRSPTRGGS